MEVIESSGNVEKMNLRFHYLLDFIYLWRKRNRKLKQKLKIVEIYPVHHLMVVESWFQQLYAGSSQGQRERERAWYGN